VKLVNVLATTLLVASVGTQAQTPQGSTSMPMKGPQSSQNAAGALTYLNSTAVHPDRTLYTLRSRFGVAPYRVQHHDELLDELTEAGYKRRDGWRNEGKSIQLPFVDGGRQGLLRRRLLRPL